MITRWNRKTYPFQLKALLGKCVLTNMNSKIEIQNPKSFPSWPYFGDDEIKAVERVLRSGKVNQWTGSEVTNMKSSFKF